MSVLEKVLTVFALVETITNIVRFILELIDRYKKR